MNIKEAAEQIKEAIEAYLVKDDHGLYCIPFRMQRPIIMLGPPGVGKTAIVEQIAEEVGINFVSYSITHHTRQSALGLPFIVSEEFDGREYSVSEYTMSEIIASVFKIRSETGVHEGILFLDEINCASETLAPAMLQFLQYKTFGMHRLPEGWIIVCAGNPPEYNRSAREFDPAMLDRLMRIDVEPNVNIWQEYATTHGVHPAVTTYLDAKPGNFYNVRAKARGSKIVTSRGWEDLSRMIQAYERLGKVPPATLPGRYLQDSAIANEFSVYYELFCKYRDDYKITDILNGTIADELVTRAQNAPLDERIALIGLMLDSILYRVHEVIEFEESLRAVRSDLLDMKSRLESSSDAPSVIQKKIESAERKSTVGNGISGHVGDSTVIRAERIRVLDRIKRAVQSREEPQSAFAVAKGAFNEECKDLQSKAKLAVNGLDNAFAYFDRSFGADSQESLIFVTKLSADPLLIKLVSHYGSAEYVKHNKNMLFTERNVELLREIESIDSSM